MVIIILPITLTYRNRKFGMFSHIKYSILCINVFILKVAVSDSSLNFTNFELNEAQISHCENWQFRCKNGQCVAKTLICDGLKDCSDASDETYDQCQNKPLKKCDELHFQCQYGACIKKNYQCDGLKQCIDGSDEAASMCSELMHKSSSLMRIKRDADGSCLVPVISPDKTVKFVCNGNPLQACTSPEGYFAQFTVATIICSTDHYRENKDNSSVHTCYNNNWSPPLTKCLKKCEQLNPVNVILQCYHDGVNINNCDGSSMLLAGTKVRPSCKPTYKYDSPPNYFEITCNDDGKWNNNLISCVPECGKPYTPAQLTIAGGEIEEIGGSPWHVAIFDSRKELLCGGTIISEHLVLSAAHCFSEDDNNCEGNNCADNFEVVIGKYTNNYTIKDNNYQRTMKIKEIRFPTKGYFALTTYYASDLAILILKDAILISPAVLPACINWMNLKDGKYPPEGKLGKIVGWGRTENHTLSTTLRTLTLPFISHRRCVDLVDSDFKPFITLDKFCAGTENRTGPAAQDGDSGGGILFEDNKLFYLQGVISVKSYGSNSVTVFTDLSEHINWIVSVRDTIETKPQLNQIQSNNAIVPIQTREKFNSVNIPTKQNEVHNEIMNDVKSFRFSTAEQKLINKDYDTYYSIVHEIYNKQVNGFDLLLSFGNAIYDMECKYKVLDYLHREIVSSGLNDPRKFLEMRKSLKKGILDRSTGALAAQNFYQLLKDEIINSTVGQILSAFQNDDSWPVRQLRTDVAENCYDCMTKIYESVIDAVWNKTNLLKLLTRMLNTNDLNDSIEVHLVVIDRLERNHSLYTLSAITLAQFMKLIMMLPGYAKVNSDKRVQYQDAQNRLPQSVKNLVFSSMICIKNTKYNEYLYPGNIFPYDVAVSESGRNVGHHVYTWIPENQEKQPNFKWHVSFQGSHQIRLRDHLFDEYLYVGEEKYNDKSRNVFTWNTTYSSNLILWNIEVIGNYISIKSTTFQEYLFADYERNTNRNVDRRYVFTHLHKKGRLNIEWYIEDCS